MRIVQSSHSDRKIWSGYKAQMSVVLESYLASWDPMGFIREGGAPLDEYSMEAEEIEKNFQLKMTISEVGELVYGIFVELTGHDFPGFKEQCLENAQEIRFLLSSANSL